MGSHGRPLSRGVAWVDTGLRWSVWPPQQTCPFPQAPAGPDVHSTPQAHGSPLSWSTPSNVPAPTACPCLPSCPSSTPHSKVHPSTFKRWICCKRAPGSGAQPGTPPGSGQACPQTFPLCPILGAQPSVAKAASTSLQGVHPGSQHAKGRAPDCRGTPSGTPDTAWGSLALLRTSGTPSNAGIPLNE